MEDIIKRINHKKKLLNQQSLSPMQLENMQAWFRVEMTYNSNALEGNTLTRQQTHLVLNENLAIANKTVIEHLEVINHAQAFDFICKLAKTTKLQDINIDLILKIHTIILSKINNDWAGRLRNIPVRVVGSRSVFPNHLKVASKLEELVLDIQTKSQTILEKAIDIHYYLVSIHPFVDGNGRTARLLMSFILMQANYSPVIIRKQDRLKYINALEEAQTGGSPTNFKKLMYQAIERSLDFYLQPRLTTKSASLIKIGQLAKSTQVTVATIRYWTNLGLLELAERLPSGYRLYDKAMIDRIIKIKKLQAQRLTLEEIKQKLKSGH